MPNYQRDLLRELTKIIARRLETLDKIEAQVQDINNVNVVITDCKIYMNPKDQKNSRVESLMNNYLKIYQKSRKYAFWANNGNLKQLNASSLAFFRPYSMVNSLKTYTAKQKLPGMILKCKTNLENIRADMKLLTLEDIEVTISYLALRYLRTDLIRQINGWQKSQSVNGSVKDKITFDSNFNRSLTLEFEFFPNRDLEEIKFILSENIPESNTSLKKLFDSLKKVIDNHNCVIQELKQEVVALNNDRKIEEFLDLEAGSNSLNKELKAFEKAVRKNL